MGKGIALSDAAVRRMLVANAYFYPLHVAPGSLIVFRGAFSRRDNS